MTSSGFRKGRAVLRIAVLEDEQPDIDNIQRALHGQNVDVKILTDFKAFVPAIKNEPFDVVSLDWLLHSYEKGKEALSLLLRVQPDAARVVLTHLENRISDAKRYKAEYCVLKRDFQDYPRLMEIAARLGRARRIVRHLVSLGQSGLPVLTSESFHAPKEDEVCKRARKCAIDLALRGEPDETLRHLLVARRWWREFDPAQYVEAPFLNKLQQLAGYAEAGIDELAGILNVEPPQLQAAFENGVPLSDIKDFGESADYLLSVFGYVLNLSGYEVELMPHYWKVADLFASCSSPPPWDDSGLAAYLRQTGNIGLRHSLEWIRSN
jgi:CheY-like chemotaxis protein